MAVTGVNHLNQIYGNAYASSRKDTVKQGNVKEAAGAGISKTNEEKLSQRAQKYLKNLRKQYGDYDLMVGNRGDDLKTLTKSGQKEFSVVFSNEELERMASDEKYANEKLGNIDRAVEMSKEINKKYGFELAAGKGSNADITKIGMVFEDDGTKSLFAQLEKSVGKQKDPLEVKSAFVQGNSMDELLGKIMGVDWSAVKPEIVQESGGKFDFSI